MNKKPRKPRSGRKDETTREPGDYEVGYGRPPKSGQFQPGQCPNPKGRPKGSRNFATIVRAVLMRKVPLVENGRRKSIIAVEGLLLQQMKNGLKDDAKAASNMLALAERVLDIEAQGDGQDDLSGRDLEIMANFLEQFDKKDKS